MRWWRWTCGARYGVLESKLEVHRAVYIDDTHHREAEVISVHPSKPVTELRVQIKRADGTTSARGRGMVLYGSLIPAASTGEVWAAPCRGRENAGRGPESSGRPAAAGRLKRGSSSSWCSAAQSERVERLPQGVNGARVWTLQNERREPCSLNRLIVFRNHDDRRAAGRDLSSHGRPWFWPPGDAIAACKRFH